MPKLTDEELIAAIEAEESVALDHHSGQLRTERSEAWARYKGELLGNEMEGRSQIVDKGVMDTIQWIVPSLARIYLGGDDIGQFEPMGPEDEYAAQCETEVCNWYLQSKNDFYSHIVATLTDALLLKNGYIAGMWTVREDVMTEEYEGLADEELAMLMQDPDVTVTEHTAYPDPTWMPPPPQPMQPGQPPQPEQPPAQLHDVVVERKKADEFVGIESIPPDEILVARRHRWTSLADADFVQWRRRVSIGQLRAEGFKIEDDVQEYSDYGTERTSRERFDQDRMFSDETPDPARKIVLFKDTYIRIDLGGSGRPKLWRVAYVDGQMKPVLKKEADCIPIAAFSPIIYPHSHIGTSVFDLINDVCMIKTMMERQLIDGTFMQTSGRMGVDVNVVNVDDLLTARPGQLVRVEGDPSAGLFPITTPDIGPTVMGALEYMDAIKEGRTGVTRYSAGLDANTLNKTATGMQAIQSAANQRIELIARTLAGGFRDLFLVIHTLASKHSTKAVQMKLKGNWQAIDPRSWAKRTDFKINVGLGTGTPEQQAQKLLIMGMPMQQAQGLGLAGPQEAYNYIAEMWKALGYKSPDKFVHPPKPKIDPQTGQAIPGQFETPPPPKDPAVQVAEMKMQGDQQKLQAEQQAEQQRFQAETVMEQQKTQQEAQLKQQEKQMDLQVQAANDQRQSELDQQKMQLEVVKIELEDKRERERMILEAQLKREEMQLHADVQLKAAEMQAQTTAYAANTSADTAKYAADSKKPPEKKPPKGYKVVRGKDGRASQLDVIQ